MIKLWTVYVNPKRGKPHYHSGPYLGTQGQEVVLYRSQKEALQWMESYKEVERDAVLCCVELAELEWR